MSSNKVLEEFTSILEYYIEYYGLDNVDIKTLLKATTDIVKDLKSGVNGPTITKAESIAQIFGIRYYQFADPNFPLPLKHDLPSATIKAINEREKNGPAVSRGTYQKLDLKLVVLETLKEFKDKKKFLPSEVHKNLPEEVKTSISATRITGLFSNELKDNVEKTGDDLKKGKAGRPEEYYKVIKL